MTAAHVPNMTDYEAERRNFALEVPDYFNFAILSETSCRPVRRCLVF